MIKKGLKVVVLAGKDKKKEGEEVSIIECKPISKKKTWQVMK